MKTNQKNVINLDDFVEKNKRESNSSLHSDNTEDQRNDHTLQILNESILDWSEENPDVTLNEEEE